LAPEFHPVVVPLVLALVGDNLGPDENQLGILEGGLPLRYASGEHG
jgi:hypothetical protein